MLANPKKEHNSLTFFFLFLVVVDCHQTASYFFLLYIIIATVFRPNCQFIMDSDNTLLPDSCLELDQLGFADSPLYSSSSGYLEDAIFNWMNPSKKRRLPTIDDEDIINSPLSNILSDELWEIDKSEDITLNFSCSSQSSGINSFTDDPLSSSISSIPILHDEEIKMNNLHLTYAFPVAQPLPNELPLNWSNSPSDEHIECIRRKEAKKRVVYPFDLVKPGGTEEDVTLGDINKRILMRPNRPVRHPVGEFACIPSTFSGRPGLSGKDVVTLIRIHTIGNGTITIIRTRG